MKEFLKIEFAREDARIMLAICWGLLAIAITFYTLQDPNIFNFILAGVLGAASMLQVALAYKSYRRYKNR